MRVFLGRCFSSVGELVSVGFDWVDSGHDRAPLPDRAGRRRDYGGAVVLPAHLHEPGAVHRLRDHRGSQCHQDLPQQPESQAYLTGTTPWQRGAPFPIRTSHTEKLVFDFNIFLVFYVTPRFVCVKRSVFKVVFFFGSDAKGTLCFQSR